MLENKEKIAISRYIKISFRTVLYIIVIMTLYIAAIDAYLIKQKGSYEISDFIIQSENALRLFFNMLSYGLSIVIAILVFDIQDYENLGKACSEYDLFEKLKNDSYSGKLEVGLLTTTIYLLLVTGMLSQWVYEIYGDNLKLSNITIGSIGIIAFICGVTWLYVRSKRISGEKKQIQTEISKDIKNIRSTSVNLEVEKIVSQMRQYYNYTNYTENDLFYRVDKLDTYSLFIDNFFGFIMGGFCTYAIAYFNTSKKSGGIISTIILGIIILYGISILIKSASSFQNGREKYLNRKEIEIIINTIEENNNEKIED